MMVVMTRMIAIITQRRGARLQSQCKGCYDDRFHGAAGDAKNVPMRVMRTWARTIITLISSCDPSVFVSYKEIKRDVRHHLQCKGCYDDSYQGTARDAQVQRCRGCCDDSCDDAGGNNHHAKEWRSSPEATQGMLGTAADAEDVCDESHEDVDDNSHHADIALQYILLYFLVLPVSYVEIKRDVKHHVQCNGCYDHSYHGTARDAEDAAMMVAITRMIAIITPRRGARLQW